MWETLEEILLRTLCRSAAFHRIVIMGLGRVCGPYICSDHFGWRCPVRPHQINFMFHGQTSSKFGPGWQAKKIKKIDEYHYEFESHLV